MISAGAPPCKLRRPLAVFKGPISKEGRGKGRGREDGKGRGGKRKGRVGEGKGWGGSPPVGKTGSASDYDFQPEIAVLRIEQMELWQVWHAMAKETSQEVRY